VTSANDLGVNLTMRAEIIAIGTELLLGDVVNTNAAWVSQKLSALGIDVYHHTTVGDNPGRIQAVVQQALDRADFLIITGGLGPTEDDLTVATIADYFNAPLVEDPASLERIKAFFIARGIQHSPNNLKQALKPADAITITNPIGTAPSMYWDVSAYTDRPNAILTFPGVPRELYAMWPEGERLIGAEMAQRGVQTQVLVTRFLHFFGIGESKLAEVLDDLMEGSNPTVAPYVGRSEVRVRIGAKASTEAEALQLIEPVKTACIQRLPDYYFAETQGADDAQIEAIVGNLLTEKNVTVAVAESCTGGLVSSRLTDVPGSSQYVALNLVTYSNAQKHQSLGVPLQDLETYGAVSPQVAAAMSQGIYHKVCQTGQTTVGLSLTGIAGPAGGSPEKPVGLAYIGLTGLGADPTAVIVKKVLVNKHYSRSDIKYWFSQYALHFLRQYLLGTLVPDVDLAPLLTTAS